MAKTKYEYWLTDEGLLQISGWARDGLIDAQIAHNMGISRKTLYEWKNKYSPISDALKNSKDVADRHVENALYNKACGYKESITKPFKVKRVEYDPKGRKIAEFEEVVYVTDEVYIPPDTTAQIFWLKNRKPEAWRDRVIHTDEAELVKLDALIGSIDKLATKK